MDDGSKFEIVCDRVMSDMDVTLSGDQITAHFDINLDCHLASAQTKRNLIDIFERYRIINAAKRQLANEIDYYFERSREMNVEVIGIGDELQRRYPKESAALIRNWYDTISKINITYDIGLNLESIGSIDNYLEPRGNYVYEDN
jgi:hypothetical protein